MTLKNKIVLITGASAGIGEACAREFAAAGAKLVLTARRGDRLEKLAAELNKAYGAEVKNLVFDIRDRSAVTKALQSLDAPWTEIDVLVNNAGLGKGLEKFHDGNIDNWETMIDTNIKGLLYVSRAVIPGMVARRRGHIINIGSIAGHEVYPNGNIYCATKHAVTAITKGMRLDLLDTPIRVTTVDPGLVETEFSLVRFDGDAARARKSYENMQALTGKDIADVVVFAATRPPHVQIAEVIVFPTCQASTTHVHRGGLK